MRYKLLVAILLATFFSPRLPWRPFPRGKEGKINCVEVYISGVGVATATPSENKIKEKLKAIKEPQYYGRS